MENNMTKFLYLFLLISSTLFSEVIINKSVKTVEGVGIGFSRQEAVNNALAEACGQINGVHVTAQKFISDTTIETSNKAASEFIFNKKIKAITKGKVDSFNIINVSENEGKYEATVSVTKTIIEKNYKVPGLDNKRRSIAILPPLTKNSLYTISDESFSASQISQTLSHELINSLTKTRKFNILDRDNINAYLAEKRVILDSNSSTDEILKLGKVISADYLIITKISQLSSNINNNKSITASFNTNSSYNINAIIEYRIITMATRQIKWSSTINQNYLISANNANEAKLKVSNLLAEQITTELLENIYPLKILKVNNEQIFINQGSLKIGTKYNVFTLGEKLYDPYTKEYMGRVEKQTGIIEITSSIAKYSIAKIIEGNVKESNICRLNNSLSSNNENPKDFGGIEKKEGGGVSLPFD